MGSWASGNYGRERRQTINDMPCIRVRDITAQPLLPGLWMPLVYGDLECLRVRGDEDRVFFGWALEDAVLAIGQADFAYSQRNFGGQQAYLQCECGKCVTALYVSDTRIACRHCHGLLYDSQFNRKYEQPAAKAAKLRAKLGGDPALLQPIPDKPKYMHRETYERITYQILAYEVAAAQELRKYRQEKWLPLLLELDDLVTAHT